MISAYTNVHNYCGLGFLLNETLMSKGDAEETGCNLIRNLNACFNGE